jgi:predicted RNase H-like nuclease
VSTLSSPPWAIGVDGVRGGWVAALRHTEGSLSWAVVERFASLLEACDDTCVIAADIPIGLPEAGARPCDREARRRLPGRTSSVFPAPTRATAADRREGVPYTEAVRRARSRGHGAPSRQTWFITDKINDVADACRDLTPMVRVLECHPEVTFADLAGAVLPRKSTAAGVGRRIGALTGWVDAAAALGDVPEGVPVVDALDALACLWTAERAVGGRAARIGDDAASIWV